MSSIPKGFKKVEYPRPSILIHEGHYSEEEVMEFLWKFTIMKVEALEQEDKLVDE